MTPPEQSGAPRAPHQPAPPSIRPAKPARAQAERPDGASPAASPNEPAATPTTPAAPVRPAVASKRPGGDAPTAVPGRSAASAASADEPPSTPSQTGPDPVAVLQTVVNELATPAAKAAPPKNGYTPRVFAFERPPKMADGGTPGAAESGGPGSGATGAGAPGAGASGAGVSGGAASGEKGAASAGAGASAAAAGAAVAGAAASSATPNAPSPAAGTPAAQGPAAQSPAAQDLAAEKPAAAAPAPVSPAAEKAGAGSTDAEKVGAESTTAENTGGENTGAGNPAANLPGQNPAAQPPAAQNPAARPPAEQAPAAQTPAAPAPADRKPAAPASASTSAAAVPADQQSAQKGAAPASGAEPAGDAPADAPSPVKQPASAAGAAAAGIAAASAASPSAPAPGAATQPAGSTPPGPRNPAAGSTPPGPGNPAAGPTPPEPVAGRTPTAPQAPTGQVPPTPAGQAPPSVPPRSLIPPTAPGAVPPSGPDAPAEAGGSSFLKPLTGAIQRVSRWAPVNPGAAPAASAQGPAGPGGPAGGPDGPGAPDAGFYGLAGDGAPSRGPKIALFAVLAVVVLFGAYALTAWGLSDRVPRETTVAGVDVGGMSRAEAASALTEQLGPRVTEPIALTAGEGKAQLSPEPSGLAVDAEGTAAELTGFSLSPVRMWAHMFGGSDEELLLDIDTEKFDAAVAGLEESLAVEPVDGTVSFVDGQPAKTDAKDGSRIVASETSRIITERWLRSEGPFDLPVETVEPAVTQQETDESFAVAQKVVSGPVTVAVGGQNPVLTPDVLAGLVRFEQREGALVTIVDRKAAVAAIVDGTTNLLEVPDDAHFEFVGGKPTVVEGKTGTTLDPAETGKAVRIAATSDDRETSVELVEQSPEETVESLQALGVKEVVSEFSTPLTNEPVRTQNLVRGAQMVTGNLIKPGETFSLLEALAPITLENGYFDAGVVEDGKHVEAVGGGLSQMATTSFNAGFFAGFDDIEHHAHSFWFPRYPAGREATIYVGAKDMKFRNDTPYGAVMQAFVSNGQLTVRIWSTKHYTVQESTSPKRNIVPKTTIHDSSAGCQPYPGGEDGFSVTISRKVLHDGKVVKENSFNHSYNPDNPVVCDGSKGSDG